MLLGWNIKTWIFTFLDFCFLSNKTDWKQGTHIYWWKTQYLMFCLSFKMFIRLIYLACSEGWQTWHVRVSEIRAKWYETYLQLWHSRMGDQCCSFRGDDFKVAPMRWSLSDAGKVKINDAVHHIRSDRGCAEDVQRNVLNIKFQRGLTTVFNKYKQKELEDTGTSHKYAKQHR